MATCCTHQRLGQRARNRSARAARSTGQNQCHCPTAPRKDPADEIQATGPTAHRTGPQRLTGQGPGNFLSESAACPSFFPREFTEDKKRGPTAVRLSARGREGEKSRFELPGYFTARKVKNLSKRLDRPILDLGRGFALGKSEKVCAASALQPARYSTGANLGDYHSGSQPPMLPSSSVSLSSGLPRPGFGPCNMSKRSSVRLPTPEPVLPTPVRLT